MHHTDRCDARKCECNIMNTNEIRWWLILTKQAAREICILTCASEHAHPLHELNRSHSLSDQVGELLDVLDVAVSEDRLSLYSGVKSKAYPTQHGSRSSKSSWQQASKQASDGKPQRSTRGPSILGLVLQDFAEERANSREWLKC